MGLVLCVVDSPLMELAGLNPPFSLHRPGPKNWLPNVSQLVILPILPNVSQIVKIIILPNVSLIDHAIC